MSDPTNDYRVTQEPPCEACGFYHGGTTARILCLRERLITARVALSTAKIHISKLEAELAPIRQLREEVRGLDSAWPPDRK